MQEVSLCDIMAIPIGTTVLYDREPRVVQQFGVVCSSLSKNGLYALKRSGPLFA